MAPRIQEKRPRGRPPLPPGERLDANLDIRISHEELDEARREAARRGIPLATLVRVLLRRARHSSRDSNSHG